MPYRIATRTGDPPLPTTKAAASRKSVFWDRIASFAGMVDIARAKLASRHVAQLSFAVADADATDFGLEAYDAVLAFNLLHLVDDLDRALAVAVRSLKPGGLFISKTPCMSEMNPLVPRLVLPLMRAIGKAPHVLCFDAARLQAAITAQGFEILSVERHGTRGKDFRVFIVARKGGLP